ncbi:MAG: Lrp/AsnC family transcriptional regulator [Nitrososphaerota archaeon]|nr:Lrp/AsnC family transcriptional regulator [Nitrososphaerota archaeon]MDG6938863.1 Lrp/AsnC family transcriptional regulator [Nitrososphaerota archaeon]
MNKFDELDMKILRELVEDTNQSVPRLSKKIQVNSSVAYSRIKRLIRRGLIKRFTIEVNDELLGYKVQAYIGVNSDAKMRDSVLKELMGLDEVRSVAEVTGRFDFVITLKTKTLEELHGTVSSKIGNIQGVEHTETFIAMRTGSKVPTYVTA